MKEESWNEDVSIKWSGANPHILYKGTLSSEDMIFISNYMVGKTHFDEMCYQLWDFSNVENLLLDEKDAHAFYLMNMAAANNWNDSVCIIVVTENKTIVDWFDKIKKQMREMGWKIKLINTPIQTSDISRLQSTALRSPLKNKHSYII